MASPLAASIVGACEGWLERHGDSPLGVGWPHSAKTRYRVMLDVVGARTAPASLLDFGCGLSHLYDFIVENHLESIEYSGLDLSEAFLAISRRKHPDRPYHSIDLLGDRAAELPVFDYVIANGIFTYKGAASHEEMFAYFRALVAQLFAKTRIGLAFNVMSKQVEWERDDLFHLPCDELATFLSRRISRHFSIRHDYGLYEYTTYVYRAPSSVESSDAKNVLFPEAAPE